eukprot:14688518-Alexandrium_andersonii.AAC.1
MRMRSPHGPPAKRVYNVCVSIAPAPAQAAPHRGQGTDAVPQQHKALQEEARAACRKRRARQAAASPCVATHGAT